MKMKLFCTIMLIALVACAAPAPTETTVPPTPTLAPPALTAIPPIPTSVPLDPFRGIPTATVPAAVPRAASQATIRVGDLDRNYWYYVPANLPRNASLLFALHGATQSSQGLRDYTGYAFETLADQNGFIVVYPQGVGNVWNDCRSISIVPSAALPAKRGNFDDVGFIHALIAKFRADYGINTSRVFAWGISNGGHLAYRLALELTDEITAIAAVAAVLPQGDYSDCRASGKPISVLIMNGTSNPGSGAASAEYFTKLNGQSSSPKTTRLPHREPSDPTSVDRTIWNDVDKPEVVLDTINVGGHVLPQGKFSTVGQLGMATGDLDGPAEIWEFFARQPSRSEVQATKLEDIIGTWLVVYSPSDRFASAENHWEHTASGERIATFLSGTMKGYKTTAKYWFENGLYKIQYPTSTGEPNSTAVGTFRVYVTKQDGKATQLRFVVVEDQYTQRVDRMTFKPWTRVEP